MASTRSRAATIPLIGGRPVLDLVNTISWRGGPDRSEDHLQSADDCLVWAARAGVLTDEEAAALAHRLASNPAARRALCTGLRDLRSVVVDTLVPPSTGPATRLDPLLRDAVTHSRLTASDDPAGRQVYRWTVSSVDQHTPRRRVVLDLLDLLMSPHGRIGVCADRECQWVYLDTTHAQNRQWCSSTDCGNRHRVRRHHQRRSAAKPPS